MAVNPCQAPITERLPAGKQTCNLFPALPDQPGSDVVAPFISHCLTPRLDRQRDDVLCDLFFGHGAGAGKVFNRLATTITRGKIHLWINSGGIMAHDLLHPAELLEDLSPVQQCKSAQAGNSIAAGKLIPGLPVQFTRVDFGEGNFERTLKPALDRCQGCGLIVEKTYQLRPEIGTGVRLHLCQFGQDRKELIGIAAVGGDQSVCPEVGQLTFTQVVQGGDRQTLYALDKRDAHHLRKCPDFTDSKRPHGLVGLGKGQDIFAVQAQFRMGDEVFGHTVNAWQAPVRVGCQNGELLIKTRRKVYKDIADVSFQDIFVVQYPIGSRRCLLFQAACCGKIRTDLTDPLT